MSFCPPRFVGGFFFGWGACAFSPSPQVTNRMMTFRYRRPAFLPFFQALELSCTGILFVSFLLAKETPRPGLSGVPNYFCRF